MHKQETSTMFDKSQFSVRLSILINQYSIWNRMRGKSFERKERESHLPKNLLNYSGKRKANCLYSWTAACESIFLAVPLLRPTFPPRVKMRTHFSMAWGTNASMNVLNNTNNKNRYRTNQHDEAARPFQVSNTNSTLNINCTARSKAHMRRCVLSNSLCFIQKGRTPRWRQEEGSWRPQERRSPQ